MQQKLFKININKKVRLHIKICSNKICGKVSQKLLLFLLLILVVKIHFYIYSIYEILLSVPFLASTLYKEFCHYFQDDLSTHEKQKTKITIEVRKNKQNFENIK